MRSLFLHQVALHPLPILKSFRYIKINQNSWSSDCNFPSVSQEETPYQEGPGGVVAYLPRAIGELSRASKLLSATASIPNGPCLLLPVPRVLMPPWVIGSLDLGSVQAPTRCSAPRYVASEPHLPLRTTSIFLELSIVHELSTTVFAVSALDHELVHHSRWQPSKSSSDRSPSWTATTIFAKRCTH